MEQGGEHVDRARYYPTSFALGGHVYAAGGNLRAVSSVERYDAETDSWSHVAAMKAPRVFASVAVVGEAGGGRDMDLFESLISRAERARH